MYQASTILRNTRLDKDLTIEEVAKRTKITKRYLQAFEEADSKNYPQEPYCSLFIRDYAHFLGLNSNEILSIFRRDYYQNHPDTQLRKSAFGFTPQFTFTVGVIAIISAFSIYLFSEYVKFNKPPQLRVNWPSAELASGISFDLSGQTDPESAVRVNQDLVVVDSEGKFSKTLMANPPELKITVESKAPSGKTTVEEKTIKVN